ncbi:MAG: MerR family transcriptional regulator, copper efflux regulator [Solirubrobacteraceae bacterium]|jgi:DNA-binding transcriptional MerR regulator|nr:MerR family transcriptional regulator, copper efflux regulator [Solirubrobacteraceae bacterium]
MDALTIQEASQITDWSPRMLRYIERAGLIEPQRSEGGYRLYGPGELQRLRTLRELVTRYDLGLGEIGFAMRLRSDAELAGAVDAWFQAVPKRPEDVPPAEWLRWEQDKHSKLLALAAAHTRPEPTSALIEEIHTR